jgi:hypothetical protein
MKITKRGRHFGPGLEGGSYREPPLARNGALFFLLFKKEGYLVSVGEGGEMWVVLDEA